MASDIRILILNGSLPFQVWVDSSSFPSSSGSVPSPVLGGADPLIFPSKRETENTLYCRWAMVFDTAALVFTDFCASARDLILNNDLIMLAALFTLCPVLWGVGGVKEGLI